MNIKNSEDVGTWQMKETNNKLISKK